MKKIKLTKLSGEKSHESSLEKRQSIDGDIIGGIWPTEPTIGKPFVISTYRTSVVEEILSPVVFRTVNSIYQWEEVK